MVDGAQSFGVIDIDLQSIGCDFYTGSMHKWLMGPLENGVVYMRGDVKDQVWPAWWVPDGNLIALQSMQNFVSWVSEMILQHRLLVVFWIFM